MGADDRSSPYHLLGGALSSIDAQDQSPEADAERLTFFTVAARYATRLGECMPEMPPDVYQACLRTIARDGFLTREITIGMLNEAAHAWHHIHGLRGHLPYNPQP